MLLLASVGNVNAPPSLLRHQRQLEGRDHLDRRRVPGAGDDVIINDLTTVIINSDPTSCRSILIKGTLNSPGLYPGDPGNWINNGTLMPGHTEWLRLPALADGTHFWKGHHQIQ